jgi:type I restriction enzyme S subunit
MSEVAISKRELPGNWATVPLGDVIQLQYGKGLTAKTRIDSGDVPVFGSSGDVGRHNEAYIKEPCIIVGRKGNIGHIFISYAPCWPIDTVYYVIPPPGIDIKYLYYQLKNLNLARLDRSTAIPGINRNDAYKVEFNLAPPEQQKRIVAKIEELFSHIDAGIAALNKAKQLLKQYRQSVLKAAVTGELTKQWREDNKDKLEPASQLLERIHKNREGKYEAAFESWELEVKILEKSGKVGRKPARPKKNKIIEFKKNDENEIPINWVFAPLAAFAKIDIGFAFKSKEFEEEGISLLRGDNIEPGSLRWKNRKCWPESKLPGFEHLFIDEGDVILAMDRPVISSGLKIAIAKKEDLPALLVQ